MLRKIILLGLVAWMVLLAPSTHASGPAAASGSLTGTVMTKDKPLSGGLMFVVAEALGPAPSPDLYWRVPDYIERLDGAGKFSLELPTGNYWTIAMHRSNGQEIGPPQEGDVFFYQAAPGGIPVRYEVKASQTTDTGQISSAFPFRKDQVRYDAGITSAEGTVAGADGKPVVGALVFAYANPSMLGRPLFASEKTGADGKFIVRFREGGTYFLKVRSLYGGGAPAPGEQVGEFIDRGPDTVKIQTGEKVKNVLLKITPFARGGGSAK